MPSLKPDHALNMAKTMKAKNDEIIEAIHQTQEANHGVVEVHFSEAGAEASVSIADEPFDPNVRIYPGV